MEKKPARANWHSISEEKLFETLETGPEGLIQKEAEKKAQRVWIQRISREKEKNSLKNFSRPV